jgi:type III restriction enzyme
MHKHVNSIAGRLSLRKPQRDALEILSRITEIAPPDKDSDRAAALATIRAEYPTVTDFERDFPSVCFALATGVGKTRLMGAFISYLYQAHGINDFFVMAPNLTIYNKLIADFTPNTPKYVFQGIAEFATEPPAIITGDDYEAKAGTLFDQLLRCKINIFNISKINTEVRGGKSPRIKRLSEYIGQSYFEYLANLPNLVLIMDESHRYRATAGVRAINELKPVLGLELTATPFTEGPKGPVPFKNVILDYPLGKAMEDGFVKEPAVVTRKNFNPAGMTPEAIERMKLEDGIRLHEGIKVELETYSRETNNRLVKPFLLVIARDTTHAKQLDTLIKSDAFFEGRYKDKVIQVDSSKTGTEEDEMIERLLKVEHTDEPTEIVIHVNMLKEGWDVTNLYTIVPLRAANARTLIEQSIGRGLRLPYGRRTGVTAVDRLNIVAHDRFQEIVDEARRPGSAIQLKQVILAPADLSAKPVTVVSPPRLDTMLGIRPEGTTGSTRVAGADEPRTFENPRDQKVAQITRDVIRTLENQPTTVPTVHALARPEVQARIRAAVEAQYQPALMELEGISTPPDIAAIVETTTKLVIQQTIEIPRILVVPAGTVQSGFKRFDLQIETMNYPPVSDELWAKHLRTDQVDIIAMGQAGADEARLEDYVVGGLVDFDDVSYDAHADLLYDLAGQVVRHLHSYLKDEAEVRKVLRCYQHDIARFVHAQMQNHYWEEAADYEVRISKGFTELKPSAYTVDANTPVMDFRDAPMDKSNMPKHLFGGFKKCLYPVQKFQSDPERKLAVILDRESDKWFRPTKGQFQIYYKSGADQPEYQPDFVAETPSAIYMLEPKNKNELQEPVVQAKRQVAETWCQNATSHAKTHGGKPWQYVLIPHDAIADNMTLDGLAHLFAARRSQSTTHNRT